MGNDILIRKVKKGDEKALAYIQTESWKNAFNTILSKEVLIDNTDINKVTEMYTMLLDKNIANGFILLINDFPHCIAYWGKARDKEFDGYAELICIHSLCENWGQGYGSMMMEHIIMEIKKEGFHKVMLWVFKENKIARSFYEKQGFLLSEKYKIFCDAIEVMYYKKL